MRSPRLLLLCIALTLPGCASLSSSSRITNPSFPLTRSEARAALREMQSDKRPFDRPVVVASGYLDPGSGVAYSAAKLRSMTPDPSQVIVVPFFSLSRFDSCRRRMIDAVQSRFPSDDPARTVPVDVVGISMGGLIARDAAIPRPASDTGSGPHRALTINRLFTIATPHRGAETANLPTLDSRVVSMRAGSEFLQRVDAAAIQDAASGNAYPIIAYTRLGDEIVGPENTIPPRGELYWVPNEPFQFAHLQVQRDDRIIADIARRLRNEHAFSTSPAAPLPE